jgi:Capsule polysaccharide biosynthesis protein
MSGKITRIRSKVGELARVALQAGCGEFQRTLGLPITSVGTHRLALEQWKQNLQPPPEIKGRVLVTALRNRSWLGVGVYTACVLRQMGYATTLLYRQSVIDAHFPNRSARFGFWPGVATLPGVELVDLDAIPVTRAEMLEFEASAQASAPSVMAYDRHVEEQDIRDGDAATRRDLAELTELLMRMGAATSKQLRNGNYDNFVLYSGLIGESPLLLEAANRLGVKSACLEGWSWRHGHMIFNYNAPALDYDITGWLRKIEPWTAEKEEEIKSYVNFLDGKYEGGSAWLDDFYLVQRAAVASTLPPGLQRFVDGEEKIFLAATNVIGDSSMLQRETIFRSQQEWCAALIEFFRDQPGAKLILRAHPAEIWAKAKVRIRMAEVARDLARDVPNVYVIDAAEPLNSFSLLPFVSAGLVWLSSIGVDMVVRGVPAIAAARPKYTGMGIVAEPATREDYFSLLRAWLEVPPRPSAQQVLMARKYLYVVFKGFSSEACSRDSFATGIRLGDPARGPDHDAFYRALLEGPAPASVRVPVTAE